MTDRHREQVPRRPRDRIRIREQVQTEHVTDRPQRPRASLSVYDRVLPCLPTTTACSPAHLSNYDSVCRVCPSAALLQSGHPPERLSTSPGVCATALQPSVCPMLSVRRSVRQFMAPTSPPVSSASRRRCAASRCRRADAPSTAFSSASTASGVNEPLIGGSCASNASVPSSPRRA
jgi:hypothetical protein